MADSGLIPSITYDPLSDPRAQSQESPLSTVESGPEAKKINNFLQSTVEHLYKLNKILLLHLYMLNKTLLLLTFSYHGLLLSFHTEKFLEYKKRRTLQLYGIIWV